MKNEITMCGYVGHDKAVAMRSQKFETERMELDRLGQETIKEVRETMRLRVEHGDIPEKHRGIIKSIFGF